MNHALAVAIVAAVAIASMPAQAQADELPPSPAPATGKCVEPPKPMPSPSPDHLAPPNHRYNVVLIPVPQKMRVIPDNALLRKFKGAHYAYVPRSDAKEFLQFLHTTLGDGPGNSITITADQPHGCRLTLSLDGSATLLHDKNDPPSKAELLDPPATPLVNHQKFGVLIPMRFVAETFGATVSWLKPRPDAEKEVAVAYRTPTVYSTHAPEFRLDIAPPTATVKPGVTQSYALTLTQTAPKLGTPMPYPSASISAPVDVGTIVGNDVHVSPTATAKSYTIAAVRAPQEPRKVKIGNPAVLYVSAICHWEAATSVTVADMSAVSDLIRQLHPSPKFDNLPSGTPTPAPLPTPSLMPSPATLISGTQVLAPANAGHMGSVVISGGDCAPATAQVTVTVTMPPSPSPTFLQHSVAVDYGTASVYDELSPGNRDWNKLLAHAELQISKSAWLSVDARSIGYRHDAQSTVPLACPPAPPAPATGGAPPGDEGCVTVAGGASQTYRTAFIARDTSTEVRGGFLLGQGAVAELAYMTASNNAFRPSVSGLGAALEVPPLLSQPFAAYGALSYYPRVSGGGISYHVLRYRAGVTYTLQPKAPSSLFLELAAVGDRRTNASNAPSSSVYQALSLGVGVKF